MSRRHVGSRPVTKRTSALAQLVAIYAQLGIDDVSEVAHRTGYSEVAIRKARREEGEQR
jgi:hypothetical protein